MDGKTKERWIIDSLPDSYVGMSPGTEESPPVPSNMIASYR